MSDFPDYEAAAIAFIEKLKDIAPNNAIISLDVDMRMIVAAVDAASSNETLYRRQCADGAACTDGLSASYPHVAACFAAVLIGEDTDV